jgi:hypothetical protein
MFLDPAVVAGISINSYAQLDQDIWKKSQSLRPQPSTDTTPAVVKVGSNTYRIPRNYISYFDILTIRVTVPGYKIPAFEPLTGETHDCFGSILQGEKAGCESIEFNVEFPFISHQESFARFTPLFTSQDPRKGPFGYDVYDIGPENARREVYTKNHDGDFILFSCLFVSSDRHIAVCDDWFTLNDGNSVHFFFHLNQIGNIPDIEVGIRNLMEGFREKGTLQ